MNKQTASRGVRLPNLGVPEPQETELRWIQLADAAKRDCHGRAAETPPEGRDQIEQ